MKAAIFSNHSPRVGFGVDRKMAVSRSQVMVVAASRNHLYRRRLQVVIDAGPRNQLQDPLQQLKNSLLREAFCVCGVRQPWGGRRRSALPEASPPSSYPSGEYRGDIRRFS